MQEHKYYFLMADHMVHEYDSYRYAKEFYENNTDDIIETNFRYVEGL